MSPLAIRIALHYHYSQFDFPERAPPQQDIIAQFVRDGILIAGHARRWNLSDRGRAYVEALMAVPLPSMPPQPQHCDQPANAPFVAPPGVDLRAQMPEGTTVIPKRMQY